MILEREKESWRNLEGEFVPRTHDPGFVVLAFLVSFIGSWTTFEVIHKRTYHRGWYNWALLFGSSLSMGGMAVWCARYIGNRAIILGAGENELQVMYNPGITTLSFFLSLGFTMITFTVVGSENTLIYARVGLGGAIAGLGFCGSHFAGQAGIMNYDCFYDVPFVIGAIGTAVITGTTALGLYSWSRSLWNSSWWMRGISAFLMGGAMSAMYWLASIGTLFRLKEGVVLEPSGAAAQNATMISVFVVSVVGCFVLVAIAAVKETYKLRIGHRARQVVLATAVFDKDGRLMVTAEGILPNKKITDSYLEQGINDTFNISHPNFQWIMRTTHNWKSIVDLVPSMKYHLLSTGLRNRFGAESDFMNDEGTPVKDYHLIFRELFCAAASDLADDLHIPMERLGIIFDNIISTDQKPKQNRFMAEKRTSSVDLEKEGLELEAIGKGQLLFLVRKVDQRGAERLQSAGYRFAATQHLIPILGAVFRIRRADLKEYFDNMYRYSDTRHMLEPGTHFGLFCARASVGAGFDVLARRDATNLLPTMQIPIDSLEEWQAEFLKTLDGENVSTCLKAFNKAARNKASPPIEKLFASQLRFSLEQLKNEIDDNFFNDSRLIATPIEVPCRGSTKRSRSGKALLLAFRIIAPLQARPPGKKCDYVPMVLFKTQQHVYPNAPDHAIFARTTYREFASMLDLQSRQSSLDLDLMTPPASPPAVPESSFLKKRSRRWFSRRSGERSSDHEMITNEQTENGRHHLGGIMVSRGVTVQITQKNPDEAIGEGQGAIPRTDLANEVSREIEVSPYVDELFKLSIKLR